MFFNKLLLFFLIVVNVIGHCTFFSNFVLKPLKESPTLNL